MAQNRQEIPGNSRSLLRHIPSRNHRPNPSDGASVMIDSQRFRAFFVATVVIVCLLVGYGFASIAAQSSQIEREATAQGALAVQVATITKRNLDNRVKNVGTWCDAINANRIESKRTIPGWKLKPLDCKALERATVGSGGPVPIPTGVGK